MASRSPKHRRPLVDRADSHTNELPQSPSPSPSRSSPPRRGTALFSNSPRPLRTGKPLIYTDADYEHGSRHSHDNDLAQAPPSPPKRPLPIPPIASPVPVLTPDGWRHSQGSSTLIDSVSNCTPSLVLDAPDELDPAQASKTAAVTANAATAAAADCVAAQSRSPQTPRRVYQYAGHQQYQSENNVPALHQHRRGVNIRTPQWDESLRVAPLQSRHAESEELFETPSSGVLTTRNSLDELIADIARFHDGLSEASHEYSSPVLPGRIGTISTNSPISLKSPPQYPRSISSSSSNCFPRKDYPDSAASGSPNLASSPDIDTPSRAGQRPTRVGVPRSVLKQKEAQSSTPLLEPSDDPFTDHIEPGAADIQFPIVKQPSSSSLYAESTLFVPKKRTEKSSYQVAPLHTKDSQNTISSSEADDFGYATIVTDKSPLSYPTEMSSDPSGPDGTPSTVARGPRPALVPNRFSSLSEGGDDLSELREIQRVQRQALRPSESFESGELSSIDVSSRPMSSRDSSGAESMPNWTRYDHKALRRGPGLSSTSTFYLSQSSLGQPSSPQALQPDTTSQDSTILSPEAARYAIFRERHFEQTSERAPEGSPEPEFNIPPLDRRILDELPSPAISTPPVARLSSVHRSDTSSRVATRSVAASTPARKHRSRRKRTRRYHDAAVRSPHLVVDRRSAVISPWQPPQPELPSEFEGVSLVNVQIAMFCTGFVCPILWFIASFLPIPAQPTYASPRQRSKRRGGEKDLETGPQSSRRNAELYWQERQHARVRWWRNLNRVMSIFGIIVIIIFIVVAVITIR